VANEKRSYPGIVSTDEMPIANPIHQTPRSEMKSRIVMAAVTVLALVGCDDGAEMIRFEKQSAYQRVFVVDRGDWRYLRFGTPDGANQSIVSLSNPGAVPSPYIRIAALGVVLTPKLDRVLMLGLGGGTYTNLLHRHFPDLAIDAVEIDPVVVETAKAFFGVKEDDRFRIHVQDGANFIRETRKAYDLVFLDAYSGDGLPRALSTPAFFDAVRAKVTDDGVVILNLFRQNGRERILLDIFETRFPHTACIRTEDGLNLVVFGKTAPFGPRAERIDAARRLVADAHLSFDLGIIAEDLRMNCIGPARTNPN
jgi:spermidine synthase